MARKAKKRKYSRGAEKEVKSEMRRYKRGTAKSGRGGKGGKVKSPQAGDRDRALEGAQERQEGAAEEILPLTTIKALLSRGYAISL